MAGWFKVYRDLEDHWVWNEKPFSKGHAWIDLILHAQFEENKKIAIKGKLYKLQRGQQARSELTLAKTWGWSRNKVRRFLSLLKSEQMLEQHSDNKTSIITIINYNKYQSILTVNDTTNDTTNDTATIQHPDTTRNTSKEGKKVIREEKIYIDPETGFSPIPDNKYEKDNENRKGDDTYPEESGSESHPTTGRGHGGDIRRRKSLDHGERTEGQGSGPDEEFTAPGDGTSDMDVGKYAINQGEQDENEKGCRANTGERTRDQSVSSRRVSGSIDSGDIDSESTGKKTGREGQRSGEADQVAHFDDSRNDGHPLPSNRTSEHTLHAPYPEREKGQDGQALKRASSKPKRRRKTKLTIEQERALRPDWWTVEEWEELISHRSDKGAKSSERAYKLIVSEFEKSKLRGYTASEILDAMSSGKGWVGYKDEWVKGKPKNSHPGNLLHTGKSIDQIKEDTLRELRERARENNSIDPSEDSQPAGESGGDGVNGSSLQSLLFG